jgi:signal transduction histidine kinase
MFASLYSRRLYVRIWLAVVGGIVVLTLAASWLLRLATEAERERFLALPRSVTLFDENGHLIGSGQGMHVRGKGTEFDVTLNDGRKITLQITRHPEQLQAQGRRPPLERAPVPLRHWPFTFLWIEVFISIAVALGVYPIVRRLTKRLEALQRAVQRWGHGELWVRVPEQGQDEVADLSRRFNDAAVRIEALVRSHKSLLANASHELRSPLARIRMGLELMGGQHSPSPGVREEISRSIAELDELIDEILLASRLDARTVENAGVVERVDLVGLAAEECARVGAELDLAEGTSSDTLEVPGVQRLLRRAIRNLLENARRYGAGQIEVDLESDAARARIIVSDRGAGVPEALHERIFEPFYRLPGASEREGGTGLGLALVKSIAERHGGAVRCENRQGGGARFVITLPR